LLSAAGLANCETGALAVQTVDNTAIQSALMLPAYMQQPRVAFFR